jgi:nucleotide-binding universal stress UspA family protein
MRVLIGIDGSEAGWEAIYQASRLVSDKDDIALYYAPPQIVFQRGSGPTTHVIQRTQRSLAESVLNEAAQRLPSNLLPKVEKIVGEHDPKTGIKIAAEKWKADLIAVGATGAGALRGLLLGSVPRALIRSTTIPVFVARKKADKRSDGVYRVLLSVDEVPQSEAVAELLAKIGWPQPSLGRVIHVVEPLFGAEVPAWLEEKAKLASDDELARAWVEEHEAQKRHKYAEMSDFSNRLPTPFAGNPPVIIEGRPAEKILETAIADDIDLIVVGTRELGTWERFMLGSTAQKLIHHAPCSVLVTHRPARA